MNFSVIAAIDKNRGLGKDGKLTWNLPGDLKHFQSVTTEVERSGTLNAVIMGRTTWDSLPEKSKPLAKRLNVVLTRNKNFSVPEGVIIASSLDQALDSLSSIGEGVNKVFVIGGASVYTQAIQHPACDRIYLTEIDKVFDCDTFFPPVNPKLFIKVETSEPITEQGISYSFVEYNHK
ncbi:MAG: dihydrofolate reductase [Patescibacteria group bacterium]